MTRCEMYILDLGPCQNEAFYRVTIDTSQSMIPFGMQKHDFCKHCTDTYNVTGYKIVGKELLNPKPVPATWGPPALPSAQTLMYSLAEWKEHSDKLAAQLDESEAAREKAERALADECREHRYTREDLADEQADYKSAHEDCVGWIREATALNVRLTESEAEREKTGEELNKALKRLAEAREWVVDLGTELRAAGFKDKNLTLFALGGMLRSWWENTHD